MTPRSLRHMLKKILTLQFDEEPPYDKIIESLKSEIRSNSKIGSDNQVIQHQFEWTHNYASVVKANILKEDNAFDSNECGMRISSMSKNDMMNFRSRFLKNNAKGRENESQGANSGQALSSYIKNSCGKFSGINGSSHNNSGNNSS